MRIGAGSIEIDAGSTPIDAIIYMTSGRNLDDIGASFERHRDGVWTTSGCLLLGVVDLQLHAFLRSPASVWRT